MLAFKQEELDKLMKENWRGQFHGVLEHLSDIDTPENIVLTAFDRDIVIFKLIAELTTTNEANIHIRFISLLDGLRYPETEEILISTKRIFDETIHEIFIEKLSKKQSKIIIKNEASDLHGFYRCVPLTLNKNSSWNTYKFNESLAVILFNNDFTEEFSLLKKTMESIVNFIEQNEEWFMFEQLEYNIHPKGGFFLYINFAKENQPYRLELSPFKNTARLILKYVEDNDSNGFPTYGYYTQSSEYKGFELQKIYNELHKNNKLALIINRSKKCYLHATIIAAQIFSLVTKYEQELSTPFDDIDELDITYKKFIERFALADEDINTCCQRLRRQIHNKTITPTLFDKQYFTFEEYENNYHLYSAEFAGVKFKFKTSALGLEIIE